METPKIRQTYPNSDEDPDPVSSDLTADTQEGQRKTITALDNEMYGVFTSKHSTGEELWIDFIFTFRPHPLKRVQSGLRISSFTSFGHEECTSTIAEESLE